MPEEIGKTETVGQDQRDMPSRRSFLGCSLAAGTALTLGGLAAAAPELRAKENATSLQRLELYPGAVDVKGQYVLPPLPYGYEALEPHIDRETMMLHHDKHHASYVKGVIEAEGGLAKARADKDFKLVEHYAQKAAFHGAGHFLHCLFWSNMTPSPGKLSADLSRAIARDFGSAEAFEAEFLAVANSVEGSGWGILAWSVPARKLVMLQARNHQHSSQWANIPLLVVDVWEHAYYKKYSNQRDAYTKAFMNVVNWQGISDSYEALRQVMG